jgi:hypothetical protein
MGGRKNAHPFAGITRIRFIGCDLSLNGTPDCDLIFAANVVKKYSFGSKYSDFKLNKYSPVL